MAAPEARVVIRIYGDSLSLPRSIDGIGCLDTYPELLRQAFEASNPGVRVGVLNRSFGGKSISGLYQQFVDDGAYMGGTSSDILVIQSGIVDCAPRPVPPPVKRAIGKLPVPLRWLASKFLHIARPLLFGAGLMWRNTEIEEFESTLERWLAAAAKTAKHIYVINIAPTTAATEKHSPGLSASIDAFNGAIVRATAQHTSATLVDVHAAIVPDVARYVDAADGHHILREGHRLYADLILALESQGRHRV